MGMPDAFQILADPTRRRLIEALRDGERSVSELVGVVDIGQPGVSRQLAILQDAQFVAVRPEGRRRLYASFQLDGQEYTAFDGGSSFAFTEAFSFVATCETQDEIDALWARLTEGGEDGPCGWLKDRFGVSWQVVPSALGQMMGDSKSGNPAKVMEALLKMRKLDLATLKRAYRSGS